MDNIYYDITNLKFDYGRWIDLYIDLHKCRKTYYYKVNRAYRNNIEEKIKFIQKYYVNKEFIIG